MRRLPLIPAICALLLAAAPLAANAAETEAPWQSYTVDSTYDDVAFELQNAIENRGLVVDHISHVGEMLNRTAKDVGATRQVYDKAEVYQFCSAVLSRKMMEANPMNLAFCPYGIFLYQSHGSGKVVVGYRRMPPGEMQEVDALLNQIAREAAGVK